MYTHPTAHAGLSVPLSAIVSTSFVPPGDFDTTLWALYVIAHLVVAVLSLLGVTLAMRKLLRVHADREWARSPHEARLDLSFCADPA